MILIVKGPEGRKQVLITSRERGPGDLSAFVWHPEGGRMADLWCAITVAMRLLKRDAG